MSGFEKRQFFKTHLYALVILLTFLRNVHLKWKLACLMTIVSEQSLFYKAKAFIKPAGYTAYHLFHRPSKFG